MEVVKDFEDSSHFDRSLLRCRACGQLYFYEFYEEIDWANGNDPTYRTWVPVEEKDVDSLLKTDIWTIHHYAPRIINDWLRDGTRRREWMRTESNGREGDGGKNDRAEAGERDAH